MPNDQLRLAEHSGYEYHDNEASCAHEYLLPFVLNRVCEISQGKSIKVIDLECGNGYVASRIAEHGHSVIGIDVSSAGIAIARASFPGISYQLCSLYEDDLLEKIGGQVVSWFPWKLWNTYSFQKNFSNRVAEYSSTAGL
jgi:SAM-dependent methyltransferase